jgi:single-stranded DNA-binding protein
VNGSALAMISGVVRNAPRLRTTKAGLSVTSFAIKVNGVEYWEASAWDRAAREEVERLDEGDAVTVVGQFSTDLIEHDGKKRIRRKINVTRVLTLIAGRRAEAKEETQPRENDEADEVAGLPAWIVQSAK